MMIAKSSSWCMSSSRIKKYNFDGNQHSVRKACCSLLPVPAAQATRCCAHNCCLPSCCVVLQQLKCFVTFLSHVAIHPAACMSVSCVLHLLQMWRGHVILRGCCLRTSRPEPRKSLPCHLQYSYRSENSIAFYFSTTCWNECAHL